MTKRAFAWAAALVLLLPVSAEAQQDPAKIGEGALVYAANCSRCHSPRSGTERTDDEWVAIIAHMRARGNLTKSQAGAVLAFLQATNLPEGGAPRGTASASVIPTNSVMPLELRALLMRWQASQAAKKPASPTGSGPGR